MAGMTIADTSCLIALDRIGRLDLLQGLYGTLTIPPAVETEYGAALPPWIVLEMPDVRSVAQLTLYSLGPGETEAIALALGRTADRLILDDDAARQLAKRLGLTVTGTVGVLLRAKSSGLISEIRQPLLDLISTGFHLSPQLVQVVLQQAGE